MVEYYRAKEMLEVVDAEPRNIDLVYRRLKAAIMKRCPNIAQPDGAMLKEVEALEKEMRLLL